MRPRTVIPLALVAMCWGPDLRAGEGLNCAYVRKATADDPYGTRRIRETAGESMGYTVQPTSDGGCVMAGHTTEGSRGGRDLLPVKIDANGGSP